MWRRAVRVTSEQREQLAWMVSHDPKPYRRERAAAILQVADGTAPHAVAREGLLVRRAPDTVYRWLDRFEDRGIAGLTMAPGRGRKPSGFPPSAA